MHLTIDVPVLFKEGEVAKFLGGDNVQAQLCAYGGTYKTKGKDSLQNDVVEMGLYDAIKKNSEKVTQLQNRVAARMVTVDSGYGEDVLSGKCPHWCAMPFA